MENSELGTVYLLHFARPFGHAKHYMGYASPGRLRVRLDEHGSYRGARLMLYVHRAGITWIVARTWDAGKARERSLKKQGGHSRKCPVCKMSRCEILIDVPFPDKQIEEVTC